jgi:NADH-quinone oxidoreductase subunit M
MPILLVALLTLPLVCAVIVAVLGSRQATAIRWISLGATSVCLLLALILASAFVDIRLRGEDKATALSKTFRPEMVPGAPAIIKPVEKGKAPVEDYHGTAWDLLRIGNGTIQFYIGLDGLNVWLVVLTALLMVPSVLVSWTSIQERVSEYYAWLLALETGMLGVFLAFDIILFYVFFELTLVPLFFLIGIWGGPARRTASIKFFIYTLAGSLITLLGVLAVIIVCYDRSPNRELTFSIPRLVELVNSLAASNPQDQAFWSTVQFWVFLALMAGFAIKVPLVPVHTWLPLAHTEAPTAGSVLLAGVLLKIGCYGFLRLSLPLAPEAALSVGVPLIGLLAVIGIIYGAFCAFAQEDFKKLVAYSSVSHLGFCMLGMFALNATGLTGSLLQMINHGLSTGALFLLVGMLYERYHTRKISDYGGMGARLGLLTCFMIFICLTSIGLPGLNGFVGEVLVFTGMYPVRPVLAILGTFGIVLGAWYLLTLVWRMFAGPEKEPKHEGHGPVKDLNFRELAALTPIALLCIFLGVYPQPVIQTSERELKLIARLVDQASTQTASGGRAPSVAAKTKPVGEGNRGE